MEKNIEKMTKLEKEAALNAMYSSPNGLEKIAAVMLNPIVRDLLHEGRVRQCFVVDKLQQGMDATYDSDVSAKACVISADGVPEFTKVESGRFIVPINPYGVQAGIKWVESNYRKFDIINRTQERAKSALQSVEDEKGFSLIDTASTGHYTAFNSAVAGALSFADVAKASAAMKKARVTPSKVCLNPSREADLYLLQNASNQPYFLPEYSEENVRKGLVGKLLGMEVLSVPNGDTITRVGADGKEQIEDLTIIPDNRVYIAGKPEFVGVFCVRQDILVETQKMVPTWEDLFAIYEIIGWGIRYCKGLAQIAIS